MTKINAEAALKVPRPETDAEAQAFARGVFIGELVANSAQALDPPKPPTRKRKPNPVKIAQSAGLPIEKIAPDGTVHIARGNAAAAYEAQLTPDEELAKWSASRAH